MALISQGTTVTFNGTAIGSVISASCSGGSASTTDATTASAGIVGSGASARVIKRVVCTGIDPGKVSVRLLGMPPYAPSAIGSFATLSFACPGGTISGQAILETFEVEASVGDLLKGSASFVFTGS